MVCWVCLGWCGVPFCYILFLFRFRWYPRGGGGLGGGRVGSAVLALGLPDLPFHMRLDALSAFFLVLLGGASAGISIYSAGYFRQGEGTPPGVHCVLYQLFLAAMALVMLADDAYLFMVAWETMALSSYFLVTSNHKIPDDPQRRLSLPADRAHRRDRHPAVLRRDAGRPGRLHLRDHAREPAHRILGERRVPARAVRLRRQGRHPAAACVAARGASGRALAGLGADERRDAEDRDLRPAARAASTCCTCSCGGGACWRWRWVC